MNRASLLHAQRVPLAGALLPDVALWDVVGTVALAWVTARLTGMDVWRALTAWVVLGSLLHAAFRADSTWSNRFLVLSGDEITEDTDAACQA